MTADRYPYTASNTGLQAVMPSWALEGRREDQVSRLRDRAVRQRLRLELAERRWDQITRAHVGPLSRGRPHPRTFGTFPRVLGYYVREKRLLELPAAVQKMTFDPCRRFGLAG